MDVTQAAAYRPALIAAALPHVRHRHDAEDVASDVYVRLLSGTRRTDSTLTLGFLRTMAKRRAIDVYRSRCLRWGLGSPRPGRHTKRENKRSVQT